MNSLDREHRGIPEPGSPSLRLALPRFRRRSAVVAVVAVVALSAVTAHLGVSPLLPAYWCFAAVLVGLAGIDVERHRIPNRIVYPALLAALPLLGVPAALSGRLDRLGVAALGGLLAFAAFLLCHLARPRALGFGDVRMAGLVGCYLGYLGLDLVVLALALGVVLAAAVGLVLVASRRAGPSDHIPLAPFLAAGGLVALVWGAPILRAWLG
ncbi:MAG: prepilin peptidase [Acidimicrobiales bacterium]